MEGSPLARSLVLSGCAINGSEILLKSHGFKRSEVWGRFCSGLFFPSPTEDQLL